MKKLILPLVAFVALAGALVASPILAHNDTAERGCGAGVCQNEPPATTCPRWDDTTAPGEGGVCAVSGAEPLRERACEQECERNADGGCTQEGEQVRQRTCEQACAQACDGNEECTGNADGTCQRTGEECGNCPNATESTECPRYGQNTDAAPAGGTCTGNGGGCGRAR